MDRSRVPQEAIDLYDQYTHSPLGRRVFLDRLARIAGGTAAAAAMLPLLRNDYAVAQVVPEKDPRLSTETAGIGVPGGMMSAYVAKPADAGGPLPAVVVVHENRGLNPHIRDVTRRVALDGYVAVAPDFLSPAHGGTPDDEDRARERVGRLDMARTLEQAVAVAAYGRDGRDDVAGPVGAVGFCWGGGVVGSMAARDPELGAAVSFYGRPIPTGEVDAVRVPLLLHYAGLDARTNAGIPEFVSALNAAGVEYGLFMYPGVNHAFHNDTGVARYDPAAAGLAWTRTLAFLDHHLRGGDD
jgi:carboxymethylenebutenolidase